MKRLFFLMAASAAFFSCNKDMPDQVGHDDVVEYQTVTIKTGDDSLAVQDTKTQLIDGKVNWSVGDVVKVCFEPDYSYNSGNAKYASVFDFTSISTVASKSAIFKGNWNSSGLYKTGIILYPQSFSFESSLPRYSTYPTTTVSYTIPDVQEAIEGSFMDDVNPSYAVVTKTDMNNNNVNVTFKNLAALLCVKFPEGDYAVKSITIESTNTSGATLTGKATPTWNTSANELQFASSSYQTAASPVTIRKSDGSSLVPGESYYAVVWPRTHKLKVTFTNADGTEAVKEISNYVYLNPGKCITLDFKSLAFEVAPYLDLSVSSLDMLARGSSSSFFVTANHTWEAVSSNTSWLTITADHDSKMVYATAAANTEPVSRTATITITSADLTKTVTVTQPPVYYRAESTSPVSTAASLEDGALYMIYFAAGSSNNQIDSYCWKTSWDGDVSAQSFSNKAADATNDMVFKFHKTSSISDSWMTDGQSYKSACSGRLQSEYNGKYQTAGGSTILDFAGANASDGVELIFANQWSSDTVYGSDIDVYNEDSRANTIYWTGGSSRASGNLAWSNNMGNVPRKWFFIKVQEVQ